MSLPNSIFSATHKEAVAYASKNRDEIAGIFEFSGITDLDLSVDAHLKLTRAARLKLTHPL